MANLDVNYYIKDGDRPTILEALHQRGLAIQAALQAAPSWHQTVSREIAQRWLSSIEQLNRGQLFDLTADQDSLMAILDAETSMGQVSSDFPDANKHRYWTAKVPGATDTVKIEIFGKSIIGLGDHPLTLRFQFDTAGVSDALFLSKRGSLHAGPEGIRVTSTEKQERERYLLNMFESLRGGLHVWYDTLGGALKTSSAVIQSVEFSDSSEFNLSLDPDAAMEIGSDFIRSDEDALGILVDRSLFKD